MRILGRLLLACALFCVLTPSSTAAAATDEAEILWDTWGVPHIFAPDDESLAYAFGWAQMRSHGDLLLRLYGQSRGRAAEYWGEDFLESDQAVWTTDLPTRAQEIYDAQSTRFRPILDAFARGINAFADAYDDTLDARFKAVLPISPVDVLAHGQRVLSLYFVGRYDSAVKSAQRWEEQPGSNAWAIGPSRSASGNAMLLCNPHLRWSDFFLFYEAQHVTPGYDFYGCTLVGFPSLSIGFSAYLGWSHTVNTYDGTDVFQLALQDGGYLFDGKVRSFDVRTHTIKVRQEEGSMLEERLAVKESVHGPVIGEKEGTAQALRIAGWDKNGTAEAWWDMSRAKNLKEFEAVLRRMELPMFNVVYADRDGNTMLLFNGLVPKKSQGDWAFWQGVAPGETSATLWTEYHGYDDLPKTVNPDSGWLQNANEPPWYMTIPYPLDPEDFPAYMAPPSAAYTGVFRPQRSQRMLLEDESITLEEVVAYKLNPRSELADRIADDLLEAAKRSKDDTVIKAAAVIGAWDHNYAAESRGALLFTRWYENYARELGGIDAKMFAKAWDNAATPLSVPDGLAAPEVAVAALAKAAAEIQGMTGALDTPWGDLMRMRQGAYDLPATGGPGGEAFRVLGFEEDDDGKYKAGHGDTFVCAVEFGETPRAYVLVTYGNATQPGSPHLGDQLPIYAKGEMRPAWRTRGEIEAHVELLEVLGR